jgi:hypothetical protein
MTDGLALAARVAGVAVGFPLLTWAFGSAVVGRFTRLDREERFAASFGVGIAAAALYAFVGFVLHAPQPLFNLAAVAAMLGTALLCRLTTEKRPEEDTPPLWPLATLFLLAYLHLVCIQALLPAYRGSYWFFDWWMHYDEAQIFVGDEAVTRTWANGYTVASRTPLFNLATAFVMGIAGHGFDTYQLASALTNICFVLALYLLLRDLFGRRAAWLALLLAPLNLWMLHNAWFTWPKMLAAYYVILALHFYLQSLRQRPADPARAGNYVVCFGSASLLAFITHQSTLLYVLPLLAHGALMALRDRAFRPTVRELLACGGLALVMVGPWYGWLAVTLGADKILHSTPVSLGDESAKFSLGAAAKWMGFNLSVSVVPVGVCEAFVTGLPTDAGRPPWSVPVAEGECFELTDGALDSLRTRGVPDDVVSRLDPITERVFLMRGDFRKELAGRLRSDELESYEGQVTEAAHQERRWFVGPPHWARLYRGVTQLYFSLLTGAVTLSLTAFLLAAGVGRLWRGPALSATKPGPAGRVVWSAVWLSLIGGTLGGAFLHPGMIPWGIAHSAVFPSAIILTALAWGLLSRASRTTALVVSCGMALEFLLMFWSHRWLLFHDPEVLEPKCGKGPHETLVPLLNETLGRGELVFLAGAILVQATLIVLLLLSCRRPTGTVAGEAK